MQFLSDVVNSLLKTTERFTVPVTTAEFAVMKTACSVCLKMCLFSFLDHLLIYLFWFSAFFIMKSNLSGYDIAIP